MAGGDSYGASLAMSNASGANNTSPYNITDNSGSASKPTNLVLYLMLGAFFLAAMWMFQRK